MIVKPKIRNNICMTAHPEGCARQVREQIEYVLGRGKLAGPRKALILGSSNGYGLAARIVSAFGCGAETAGLAYERPGSASRSASSGWYNDRAFLEAARKAGIPAWSVNGDAFSEDVKGETARLVRDRLGRIDLLIYSLAAPRRMDPKTGLLHSMVIKPVGEPFTAGTVDFQTGDIVEKTIEPAAEEEIDSAVKVMGGEDWRLWIELLRREEILGENPLTVAFSYIGPEATAPIYRNGTIGRAKQHLEATAEDLDAELGTVGGRALVSVNKALITRASAVVPGVPLYLSLLYRVMKRKGLHEGCIHQMVRLFADHLYGGDPLRLDRRRRIRLDDREMREDVQREVAALWEEVRTGDMKAPADIREFRGEFLRHHGFAIEGVDYDAEVES